MHTRAGKDVIPTIYSVTRVLLSGILGRFSLELEARAQVYGPAFKFQLCSISIPLRLPHPHESRPASKSTGYNFVLNPNNRTFGFLNQIPGCVALGGTAVLTGMLDARMLNQVAGSVGGMEWMCLKRDVQISWESWPHGLMALNSQGFISWTKFSGLEEFRISRRNLGHEEFF